MGQIMPRFAPEFYRAAVQPHLTWRHSYTHNDRVLLKKPTTNTLHLARLSGSEKLLLVTTSHRRPILRRQKSKRTAKKIRKLNIELPII